MLKNEVTVLFPDLMMLISLYKGHLLIVVCFKFDSNIITNMDNKIKSVNSRKPSSGTPLSSDSNFSYSTETQHPYLNSKTKTTIYKSVNGGLNVTYFN